MVAQSALACREALAAEDSNRAFSADTVADASSATRARASVERQSRARADSACTRRRSLSDIALTAICRAASAASAVALAAGADDCISIGSRRDRAVEASHYRRPIRSSDGSGEFCRERFKPNTLPRGHKSAVLGGEDIGHCCGSGVI